MRFLAEKGIECGVHYPVPIHLQEAYRSLGYERGAFPIAERCAIDQHRHSGTSPSGRSINSCSFSRLASMKLSLTADFSTP